MSIRVKTRGGNHVSRKPDELRSAYFMLAGFEGSILDCVANCSYQMARYGTLST